ncbi:DinB family protein [Gracilimonas sediminicola]|uniref:DinB family protein n=1 Tax=Gracilimonas sediminicola TaxID=2952158 RepID=UPI0038D481CD
MKNSSYTYDYFSGAFEQAKITAEDLVQSVDNDVFLRKPNEDKWCMGEILNHLLQAGNEYLPQIKKGLNRPDEDLAKGGEPFAPNFLFRWFIHIVSPQYNRAVPTVKPFEPKNVDEINREEVLSDFLALQDEFIHLIKKAKLEQLNLDRIKTRNPIIKFVPMSLTACFGVQDAHQRRHFKQMKALKEQFTVG